MGKKQNKKLQEYQNNLELRDKNLFYLPGYSITEDVAIQKLILLAENILKLSESSNENFKIIIGYKSLNKLFYDRRKNKVDNLEKIPNDFNSINDQNIENIFYCLDNPIFEDSQLYFTLNSKNSPINKKLIKLINKIEATDPKGFLETFSKKINLFDLMSKNSSFKQAIIHRELMDLYFKFDVKYDINEEMQNDSKVKVIFNIPKIFDDEFTEVTTYVWTYELKSLLRGKLKPSLKTHLTLLKKVPKIDFSNL